MRIEAFKAEHLSQIEAQPAQVTELQAITPVWREHLAEHPSFSGYVGAELIACAGVVDERYMWAILSRTAARHMLALTRVGRRMLALYPERDIDTHVAQDFGPGCRWLQMLGFRLEHTLPKFGPDGSDHYFYRRRAWAC